MTTEQTQIIEAIIALAKARESAIAHGESTKEIDEAMNTLGAKLAAL